MALDESFVNLVLDKLKDLDNITTKRMFGGMGIFHEEQMFAKIGGDKFWLKVDDSNKEDFIAKGMEPFYNEKKKKGMPYWQVPTEVLESDKELKKWAEKSILINKK